MSLGEIFDFSKIWVFLLWVIIPMIILVKNYLSARIFNSFEIGYLVISVMAIGMYENILFSLVYIAVILIYVVWWSIQFQKFRDDNPGQYEQYKKYYSEYYGDDLNNDGIKDAFEHWQIAHDPRFFWIFGSKMAKERKRFEREKAIFSFRTNANFEGIYKESAQNARTYNQSGKQNAQRSYAERSGAAAPPPMTEEERKIAKQHAFAREHNLRYFAMCESKDEAKKLYRKYAAKYHPDNRVTGDKEKFIKIDEEYNRYCSIPGIS